MSSLARRDELLYESDAALRLVDRAIQEMNVLNDADADGEAVSVAAGEPVATDRDLDSAD